eukprot:CAMPEP_0197238604 /NCGR_PEP_ID=MMETSP1429-20130617/5106_1 /TAXON_ID=49237 /ORGANISM="Chaetoceros  sp., Strain UNC1202" /LENGTH=165 /DNA_ID=CAMNT_0042697805 /DNA_START=120 /DNA_END=618 /DNA_ORIENTATION=-
MSTLMQGPEFQHILRILNTNVEGKRNVVFALTKIRGLGRRFADLICKKAEVDVNKRAGELTADEIEKLVAIIQNPRQFKIPLWFLNRQKDFKTGKYSQVFAQNFDAKLRDDIERMKKIRAHRGLGIGGESGFVGSTLALPDVGVSKSRSLRMIEFLFDSAVIGTK